MWCVLVFNVRGEGGTLTGLKLCGLGLLNGNSRKALLRLAMFGKLSRGFLPLKERVNSTPTWSLGRLPLVQATAGTASCVTVTGGRAVLNSIFGLRSLHGWFLGVKSSGCLARGCAACITCAHFPLLRR